MNTPARMRKSSTHRQLCPSGGALLGALLAWSAWTVGLQAEPTVKTLGGGRLTVNGPDAGFSDGDILQAAQFHSPYGCAVDTTGRIYVADRDNGALRRLDPAANRARTLLTGLKVPVAVIVDLTNSVYVLTQQDGTIVKLQRGTTSVLATGLIAPSAMTWDGDAALYVAQTAGTVVRVSLADGAVSSPIITGLNQPSGIAYLDNGFVAVSEAGSNQIRIWDPRNGALKSRVGTGVAGFADGPATIAQFNQPQHLAKAPGGSMLVADRLNHRVRLIESDGFVTSLYGVDPTLWEGPACTTCDPIILPGWFDGSVEFAEAREPVGVAVSSDGKIYTTEDFYHLVREISGASFVDGGGSGETNTLYAPVISPNSGYFPMGQIIQVTNPNVSALLPSAVYYTTDGTEPTTNSLRVVMDGNAGSILWQEKRRDLTSLRLIAFVGSKSSPITSGQSVVANEIGISQNVAAGIGSTAILPVVVNLRTNEQLQSLQYRLEVSPISSGTPMIPETFGAISYSTNDFITVYTAADPKGEANFRVLPYNFDQTRGVAVTFIGTNANLSVKAFGVVGMITVPIPPSAHVGDRYKVSLLNPSGTSDGGEQRVAIAAMPDRILEVQAAHYLVGDSASAIWYNSAQLDATGALRQGFGDGILDNSDVNNVFSVALGMRVPYPHTDLFDAMDAFPEDTITSAGGDGLIRFLDWQVILMRSLGLDPARWERVWADGGVRITRGSNSPGAPNTAGVKLTALPGEVWSRQVVLAAQSFEVVQPGAILDVPVTLDVAAGCELAGLAFRAMVRADGGAPLLDRPIQFVPAASIPAPTQSLVPSYDTVLCGWPLVPSSSFDPTLRGKVLLGYIRVPVPWRSTQGQTYTVHFSNADGSPDIQTQYEFETKSGTLWILSYADKPADVSSDEWKQHFFGSALSDTAIDSADPDHDGTPNYLEYLSGTDPTDPQSFLRLNAAPLDAQGKNVVLSWLSAPGKTYQIEMATSLLGKDWTVVANGLIGTGRSQQWIHSMNTNNNSFYRIRLQP